MPNSAVTLETQIPFDIYSALRAHGIHRQQLGEESRRLLALRYFREHMLSLGQAARLSGLDYWSFVEFLAANDVAIIDLDDEELLDEFSTVMRISKQLKKVQE